MTSPPSFERLDYLLRTNKHIERKLVFDVLHSVAQKVKFDNHWYLGFGSMWFGDFKLAHRQLGLDTLKSIEREINAPRAEFNRPFAGVEVKGGECHDVLSSFDADAWSKPVVAWLDYDGHLSSSVVGDLDLLLRKGAPNSAIIVTINGARSTYRVRRPDGILKREETSVGVVEHFLGSHCIPARFQPTENAAGAFIDIAEDHFPEFLTEAVITFMQHRVNESAREYGGRRVSFVPLYRLHHRDGADMVTVGGALVTDATADAWSSSLNRHPILSTDGGVAYRRLDLVPITVREKLALDTCLPTTAADDAYIANVRAAGVRLDDAQIRKYRQFYRHFPVFIEVSV